jgi:hypothetical protein
MLIVGMWFTRKEQPARAGIFYCFNGVGSMTGGILFYGVGQLEGFPVWSESKSCASDCRHQANDPQGSSSCYAEA